MERKSWVVWLCEGRRGFTNSELSLLQKFHFRNDKISPLISTYLINQIKVSKSRVLTQLPYTENLILREAFLHHRRRFYFLLFSARVRSNLLPWVKNAFLPMGGRKLITNITNCHYLPQRHTNTVCKIKSFIIRPAFTFNNWLGLRWGSNK